MKENIINYFKELKKEASVYKILKAFNVKSIDEKMEIYNILYELELSGFLLNLNNNSYIRVPENFYLKHGVINKSTKGNLYVSLDKGDIALISKDDEALVNVGDTIFFEPIKDENFKHKYKCNIKRVVRLYEDETNYLISSVIEKEFHKRVFYVKNNDGHKVIIPDEYLCDAFVGDEVSVRIMYEKGEYYGRVEKVNKRKMKEHVFTVVKYNNMLVGMPLTGSSLSIIKNIPDGYKEGDYLVYKLDENGKFVLDDVGKFASEIEAFAKEFGIKCEFDEETLKEVEGLESNITYKNRLDLRNLTTFTIDSEGAKDLDDAISIEKKGNHFILYVSIADVSYYVHPGMHTFKEALSRGTSVYPANLVIPMLPKKLSNEICSLNEGEEKLTKTVIMEIDETGEVVDFNIVNSVIKSDKKMSYKNVNLLIDGTLFPEDYLKYYNTLSCMNELANILQIRRMKRGYIYLNTDEYEYEIDDDGEVKSIDLREKGQSHLIVENFMLIANEIVASYLKNLGVTGAYRNHECPSPTKILELKRKFHELGKHIKGLTNASNPKILQKMLLSIMNGKTDEEIAYISKIMLKSMSRAYYSSVSKGHYGLALEDYAQFTSPIRRFTDLLNHLVIGYIIDGRFEELDELTENYESMCEHATEKQLEASMFEDMVNDLLMQRYLKKYIGQELEAKIKFVGTDFIYIKTINGLCGIIPLEHKINKLSDDVIINGIKLKVGDNIIVMLNELKNVRTELEFKFLEKRLNKQRKKEMNI